MSGANETLVCMLQRPGSGELSAVKRSGVSRPLDRTMLVRPGAGTGRFLQVPDGLDHFASRTSCLGESRARYVHTEADGSRGNLRVRADEQWRSETPPGWGTPRTHPHSARRRVAGSARRASASPSRRDGRQEIAESRGRRATSILMQTTRRLPRRADSGAKAAATGYYSSRAIFIRMSASAGASE